MSWRRLMVVGAAVLAATAAGGVLAVALTVATGGAARWFPSMDRFALWWAAGSAAAVAGTGLLVWRVQAWYERKSEELVPAVRLPDPWVVDRPAEVNQVVTALLSESGGTVGITAVQGAGGFGKTTIARMVRADPRILHAFKGRVYWVTVGRDAASDALALLVNGLIGRIDPGRALTAADAAQAAEQLAAVLAVGPRRLVVLDDVWTDEQLAAFPLAGQSARLITTRNPSLTLGSTMVPVRVDQMSGEQALALLKTGLPPLPDNLAAALVAETGRWPLLLRLASMALADQVKLDPDITKAAGKLLGKLRQGGKLEMGTSAGAAGRPLDVSDPVQRSKAVKATIEAGTGLLSPRELDRFAELAVFAEDEMIPVTLIMTLWQVTGGLDQMTAGTLCARLADLALVTLTPSADGGTIALHDVVRDFLRGELGDLRLAGLHQVLLDGVAAGLPGAPAVDRPGSTVTAWWELPGSARYLWEHLIDHMAAAQRAGDAEEAAADLRWVGARLRVSGPAGPYADLALIGSPRADRLRRVLGQAAHLLTPTEPPHSLIDILYSRVSHDPEWAAQVRAFAPGRELPALTNEWPLPDPPDPAQLRTLTGRTSEASQVTAMAVAPDGSWLATAGRDGVRIWDLATGQQTAFLAADTREGTAIAFAPDGSWLATTGAIGVRIWDPATGRQTGAQKYPGAARRIAVAPDGSWLASAGWARAVRVWDPATGQPIAALPGHTHAVDAMAVAPDGSWLATAQWDGPVRIWEPATGRRIATLATLAGHTSTATAMAVAPDGTWLATAEPNGPVRVWDPATGQQKLTLIASTRYRTAMAVAPNGAWLATAGRDGVRIWDPATGRQTATLARHTQVVEAMAVAPDGSWLATAGRDGVRIWDPLTGRQTAIFVGHTHGVTAMAVAPDGSWLASAGWDGLVRIWDPTPGRPRVTLARHMDPVSAVAFAPDGAWLATAGRDGVRIWDPAAGPDHPALISPAAPAWDVAVAPGGWLAIAGKEGALIWDLATRQYRTLLTGSSRRVTAVSAAPDGTWLAVGEQDGVRIWDPATGQQRVCLAEPQRFSLFAHPIRAMKVAIAPDGTWLAATATRDESVRIWDLATGQQRVCLAEPQRFSPFRNARRAIRVGKVQRGTWRWLASGIEVRRVTSVAIAPDGTWLASAFSDGLVRIWDLAIRRPRATLTGHTGEVRAVAVAPDGNWLATAGRDGSLRVWDPATGLIRAVMRVDGPLRDCSWSPSGRALAAAGDNGLYLFTFQAPTT